MELPQAYTREIARLTGKGGIWFPGDQLEIGTTGFFDDGLFRPRGHIEDFGIGIETVVSETPSNYSFTSSSGVEIKTKLKGETDKSFKMLTKGDAGIEIDFSRENAIVFSAPECYQHKIKKEDKLIDELIDKINDEGANWEKRRAVITELQKASSIRILFSRSKNASIAFWAGASAGSGPFTIADLSGNLEVADRRGEIFETTNQGSTPLFLALRLKRIWWSQQLVPYSVVEGFDMYEETGSRDPRTEPFEWIGFDPLTLDE